MLRLDAEARQDLWRRVAEVVEEYAGRVSQGRVAPETDPETLRSLLAPFDFSQPLDPQAAFGFAVDGLWQHQLHTPHARYFGMFNPAPTDMGIAADALVATFNPQLATWGHSPFPVEVEQHLIRCLGERFGYDPARLEGTFTSGGAEANQTALLTALTKAFPETGRRGLMALRSQPVFYVTPSTHDSFHKAARMVGLGSETMREVAVDANLRMRPDDLAERIRQDREDGLAPFLIVATAGSTAAGVVDPLADLASIAEEERLWLHVDAAWGGAAVLLPELRPLLDGIGRASSITFDAHKWLSVPMGAGLYLTRVSGILERTFRVSAGYMPREGKGEGSVATVDPYAHSMQWSRRFIGLKLFLSLAVAGWAGYEEAIRHQVAMGDRLRDGLRASGWTVVNDTPLPLVCFVGAGSEGRSAAFLEGVAADVVASGEAWLSTVGLGESNQALRACITNYRTGPEDVDALLAALDRARGRLAGASALSTVDA